MKIYRLSATYITSGLLLLVNVGGCASTPTFRGFFEEHRAEIPVTDQGLLLETLRAIALLEDYCSALEERDMERLLACYSPRYSHYEHGLEWRKAWIEESYFKPFGGLEARFGPVTFEFVRKYSGYWMRQEDFDWLHSPRGKGSPTRSYRITLPTGGGPVELLLGAPPAGKDSDQKSSPALLPGTEREEESGEEPLPVSVSSLVDTGVERPLGEVTFPLTIRGRLSAGEAAGNFSSTLRERMIFLLEKEGGEWRIISQY